MLALTQTADGSFKLVTAEGECVGGDVLKLGDTNMRVRFPMDLRDFVNAWSMEGPTHHGVIGSGLYADQIIVVAKALNIQVKSICKL
jgi:L-arabinose isomerase